MSREIDDLRNAAGEYSKEALEARKKFIELRHMQDVEISSMLYRMADQVASEIRKEIVNLPFGTSSLQLDYMEKLEKVLRQEAEKLNINMTKAVKGYIERAVEGGSGFSRAVTVNLFDAAEIKSIQVDEMFYRINRRVVDACWQRTQKGLKLSDMIWQKGQNFSNDITEIVRQSIVTGQDAVTTARTLERYVRQDTKTIVKDYPNLMKHLEGKVPKNLCYESLRLVRTETTSAFGEATIAAAKISPSYLGIKWVLSKSHPIPDICDDLAAHEEGLGRGVYRPGNEPHFPAHPNEMCFLVPVHEQPEDMVTKLKQWEKDSKSQPKIEKWHQEIYLQR